ncbi:MAG: glutathione S-transferase N-terminal domain-containing protein [Pseudomonadota bacterium]
MKLRYSSTSPYVRKVTICAAELGLSERIERIATDPWDPATDLVDDNPLGRVPALTTDEGDTLYDSAVICLYLDSLSDAQDLFPSGDNRWRVLRQHEMMNGVLDAGVAALIERAKRPEDKIWPDWVEFQLGAIRRSLTVMDSEISELAAESLNIAQINTGVALGYLDFRYADMLDWRAEHQALAQWYETFSQRESMQSSVPVMPS